MDFVSEEHLPSVVYHYCSCSSFMSIATKRELWLSNSYRSNDATESRYFFSMFDEVVSRRFIGSQQIVQPLRDYLLLNWRDPYIICFSENGDLLSQWTMYADRGQGFSIGINPKAFPFEARVPLHTEVMDSSSGWAKVEYNRSKQMQQIGEAIAIYKRSADADS